METRSPVSRSGALTVAVLLIAAGVATLVLRSMGIDPIDRIAETGWPLFVILPGLALLAAAVVPEPPKGLGFAIAGSIVTSIGLLLWYQELANHYESWAYAWALVGPGAAGVGLLGYGALTRHGELVRQGLRLVIVATGLFLAGAWYFETIFGSGRVPVDLEAWWPVALIAVGALVVVGELARPRRGGPTQHHPVH
jgi:hypothetical protein